MGQCERRFPPLAIVAGVIILITAACHSAPRVRRISPHVTATYFVDNASIAVTYGRPSKRGRTIFGVLVPYHQVWMPGADEATIIRSTRPLQFESIVLRAGSYSLYTFPTENDWTLIVNRQTGQWHTIYNPDLDVARIQGQIERLTLPTEQLTIAAVPRAQGGILRIEWDTIAFTAPFIVRR
jgi:hypothetical protein